MRLAKSSAFSTLKNLASFWSAPMFKHKPVDFKFRKAFCGTRSDDQALGTPCELARPCSSFMKSSRSPSSPDRATVSASIRTRGAQFGAARFPRLCARIRRSAEAVRPDHSRLAMWVTINRGLFSLNYRRSRYLEAVKRLHTLLSHDERGGRLSLTPALATGSDGWLSCAKTWWL